MSCLRFQGGRASLAAALVAVMLAATAPVASAQAKVLGHPAGKTEPTPAQAPVKTKKPGKTEAPGAPQKPVHTGLENLEKQVQTFTLANGLRFIVVERHQAPVFSFFTVVNAGSADDQIGTTGLAHMMEHMAFKGTTIVGTNDWADEKPALTIEDRDYAALLDEQRKGLKADSTRLAALIQSFKDAQTASAKYVVTNESTRLIEQAGGQGINAFTANDITAYFYSLPSNRLEFWAAMHAGTFADPVFREFYKERDVVYEERRMRTESSPFGRLIQEFTNIAYVAHPYGFGGIGFPSDLHTFSREDGERFFRDHYVAKNMVIALVGDVKLDEAKRIAEKYFGRLSDAPAPPPVDTVEPEQKAERRVTLEESSQPTILIGWHIPAASDPTYAAYKALADLLGGGDYARLNKVLVKERKVATQVQVFTGYPGEKYPGLLGMVVVPASGQDPLEVEKQVYALMDSIATRHPFTAEELAGYQTRIKAQKIGAAGDNSSLASELAQAEVIYGGWREFFREQERIQSLTPAQVMAAMKRSCTRSNRTVGMIVNPPTAAHEEGR
ncbi:MAG: M16 family metallopeptidase [Candidatus Eisenbacteria bacterium]